jgi:predicted enzyme related to lactoylglutathione lyase
MPQNESLDMVRGLGTVIYHVTDLERAKAWYATAFGQQPYFDQPFYVGFNIAGYELGLNPDTSTNRPGSGGVVAYWRVDDIDGAVRHFVSVGAAVAAPVEEVGDGIKVATVTDPFGNAIGLLYNPHFKLPQP